MNSIKLNEEVLMFGNDEHFVKVTKTEFYGRLYHIYSSEICDCYVRLSADAAYIVYRFLLPYMEIDYNDIYDALKQEL